MVAPGSPSGTTLWSLRPLLTQVIWVPAATVTVCGRKLLSRAMTWATSPFVGNVGATVSPGASVADGAGAWATVVRADSASFGSAAQPVAMATSSAATIQCARPFRTCIRFLRR